MDPFARLGAFLDNLARKVVILGLAVAAVVGAWMYLLRDPSPAERLQQSSPGWTVVAKDGYPVRADDASGRGEVMLSPDDLFGAKRLGRVDCAEVRKVWPAWFVLPDVALGNCARLDSEDGTRWILNVTTPMQVSQIWEGHFAPIIDRLQLPHVGGRSGRLRQGAATAGQAVPDPRGNGSYTVDPPYGSGERVVAISFYRWSEKTELVFSFRPPYPPAPASPASAP